ncbi:hypothetical protein M514_04139 [Trichuris suis]|uniref:Uncharacterized protein n=1 Tax=Trichuris suis TaxID=68888 RepID=A0A085NG37_9BILA|nr:hypothetical protein M514_04139 [Trichuris suis]
MAICLNRRNLDGISFRSGILPFLILGIHAKDHNLQYSDRGKLLMQLGQWKKLVEHKIQFESPLEILREPMNVWTM